PATTAPRTPDTGSRAGTRATGAAVHATLARRTESGPQPGSPSAYALNFISTRLATASRNNGGLPMAASASVPDELDERVLRVVHRLLREEPRDEWLDSTGACSHLKLSKHH